MKQAKIAIAAAALAASTVVGVSALTAGTAAAEPTVGARCTDQSGAPGYYIWENPDKTAYHNNLICKITGDAPRGGHRPDPNPFGS